MAFVATAGVPDADAVDRARNRLQHRGYRVKVFGDLQARRGYLAGADPARAQALMAAFADPDCSAVLPIRGGYGCVRLLEHLDFDLLRANPKIFVGFSDNTVLHAALWKRCRMVTFHGPHPVDGIGHKASWPAVTERSFWKALESNYVGRVESDNAELEPITQGSASGRLVGGNLSLVCSLLGTDYQVETQDNILLLEDIGEPPYRVDRMLAQLHHAGAFQNVAGILIGHFTNCHSTDPTRSLTLEQVWADYLSHLDVPVLSDFPSGHERHNLTLPFGTMCTINCDDASVSIDEPACA